MSRSGLRRVLVTVVALAVTATVLVVARLSGDRGGAADAVRTPVDVATVVVERTDLADSQVFPGTLGYPSKGTVMGSGDGVVTQLPKVGTPIERGRMLYRVNDQPVAVFFGDTPLFRDLTAPGTAVETDVDTASGESTPDDDGTSGAEGDENEEPGSGTGDGKTPQEPLHGRDVTVVADNLRALGYDIGTRPARVQGGDVYTPALAAAVGRWQKQAGMDGDGVIGAADILVLPGRARVASVEAHLGDPAASSLLSLSSMSKAVTVTVGAGAAGQMRTGDAVVVTMPDSREVKAEIGAISRVAKKSDDESSTVSTLNVTVRAERAADLARLDVADVQVKFATSFREGVLAVPVSALLALKGGGYALRTPDGQLHAVTTGLFTDGLVEVDGEGITEGLRVEASG